MVDLAIAENAKILIRLAEQNKKNRPVKAGLFVIPVVQYRWIECDKLVQQSANVGFDLCILAVFKEALLEALTGNGGFHQFLIDSTQ